MFIHNFVTNESSFWIKVEDIKYNRVKVLLKQKLKLSEITEITQFLPLFFPKTNYLKTK